MTTYDDLTPGFDLGAAYDLASAYRYAADQLDAVLSRRAQLAQTALAKGTPSQWCGRYADEFEQQLSASQMPVTELIPILRVVASTIDNQVADERARIASGPRHQ